MTNQSLMTCGIHVSLNSFFLLMKQNTFTIGDATEEKLIGSDGLVWTRGIWDSSFKIWSPNGKITWQFHCNILKYI